MEKQNNRKEYLKRYKEQNKEKLSEYQKKYRKENREKYLEYKKKYRKEYFKRYREENRGRLLEYQKMYMREKRNSLKENPEHPFNYVDYIKIENERKKRSKIPNKVQQLHETYFKREWGI